MNMFLFLIMQFFISQIKRNRWLTLTNAIYFSYPILTCLNFADNSFSDFFSLNVPLDTPFRPILSQTLVLFYGIPINISVTFTETIHFEVIFITKLNCYAQKITLIQYIFENPLRNIKPLLIILWLD